MGNREDLLTAAKTLVRTKGYSRTTARDIAAEAKTSLASIGYHFRTTEALLNTALIEALAEFGEEFNAATAEEAKADDFTARFAGLLTGVIDSISEGRRLWLANFEALVEVDNVPGLREEIARSMNEAQERFGQVLAPDAGTDEQLVIGATFAALVNGLITQWLVDPDNAPRPADIIEGMKAIADGFT